MQGIWDVKVPCVLASGFGATFKDLTSQSRLRQHPHAVWRRGIFCSGSLPWGSSLAKQGSTAWKSFGKASSPDTPLGLQSHAPSCPDADGLGDALASRKVPLSRDLVVRKTSQPLKQQRDKKCPCLRVQLVGICS
eukprot:s2295_g6.t1